MPTDINIDKRITLYNLLLLCVLLLFFILIVYKLEFISSVILFNRFLIYIGTS